jgi:hypothetical protein
MEISLNKPTGIKIKGKNASAVVTPEKIAVENYQITGPGEYEISGIDVIGLAGGVFRLRVDGVSVGCLTRKLTDDEKSRLGTINIVILPAGIELDAGLEASYVLPQGEPEEVAKFAKSLGAENITPAPKLVTTPEKLPETTTVVVLK